MELVNQLQGEIQDISDPPVKITQNTAAFTFHFYQKQFVVEANSRAIKVHKCLVIDRISGQVSEQSTFQPSEKQIVFSALLGTLTILDKVFLVMAEEVSHVCIIEKHDIFQIQSIHFIPFEQETVIFQSPKAQEILTIIGNLRKLFLTGFYFSYTYDLTLSKIKQSIGEQRDYGFVWNNHLMKYFKQNTIDSKWLTPIIQGYIGFFTVYLEGKKLDFYLISRRSSKRAGTRFNSRGIDDDGNVSNYCESEQLVYYDNICCSHLQIRGSVPIFWTQRGYLTETKINRTAEMTKQAFINHFDDYSRVICINLMTKHKSPEQLITEGFEEQIKLNTSDHIRYEWFDFHHECRGQQFSQSNPLIRKLHEHNQNFGFYLEDLSSKKVHYFQRGVFRTNCMDCLDRTNFVQTKLAMDIFDNQMKVLGVDLTSILKQSPIESLDEEDSKLQIPLISFFKNIWADNGDMLSSQYTGTGSTHTNVTRTGRRDIQGMIDHGKKSLLRFYMQNFEDNLKQEAIDILLGTHTETTNAFNVNIERELKNREKEFSEFNDLSVQLVTWNIGGAEVSSTFDLSKTIFSNCCDLVVVSLQEMITSNAKAVVNFTNERVKQWTQLLLQNLNAHERYVIIKAKDLMGIATFILAKDAIKDRITRVNYDTVKLGFMGSFANKGSVVIKLYLDDTLLCFTNVHLEHGAKSLNTRLANLSDIHQKAFNVVHIGKKKEEKIEQCDYRFLLGDLNFRIQLQSNEVIQFVKKRKTYLEQKKDKQAQDVQQYRIIFTLYQKNIKRYLLNYDELLTSRRSNKILDNYKEGAITFDPTYKYEEYSTIYDNNRTPSWTDRILLWTELENTQTSYQRFEINLSDHRPVSATYKIKIRREIINKRDQILQDIYEKDQSLKKAMGDEKIIKSLQEIDQ